MTIRDLIKKLKDHKIDLALDGNDLEINFDGDELPEDLLNEIRVNKTGIIKFLRGVHGVVEAPIPQAPKQDSYVLSSTQRRMWLVSQIEEANIAYNNTSFTRFNGNLDIDAFERALQAMNERHEVLRTVFKVDASGETRQVVLPASEIGFSVVHKDLRNEKDPEAAAKEYINKVTLIPFDLEKGPLIAAYMVQVADHKRIFCNITHHILSDGWSGGIYSQELVLLYEMFRNGQPNPLPPLRIHYKDYAEWQAAQLNNGSASGLKAYWMKQMEGELPLLDLPGDMARPPLKTYNGATFYNLLSPTLSKALKDYTMAQGGTLFMGILSAVNILLHRYTGQEDIIVGFPVSGREHPDVAGQIGCYINTLTMRTRFKATDTGKQLFDNIRQITLDGYEHQEFPFDELVNSLDLVRDRSRNPIFDVVVVLHNATGSSSAELTTEAVENMEAVQDQTLQQGPANELQVGSYDHTNVISKYDLNFDFGEQGDTIFTKIEYNSDIYKPGTIQQMIAHLEAVIREFTANPDLPINQLNILSEAQKQQQLITFNNTVAAYPKEKTIAALFEEQVAKAPDNLAVIYKNTHLTYKELDEKANKLAHYLQTEHKVQPNDRIGIMLDVSENLMIAILGILKSGAAYVPMDASYPQARKELVVNDTAIKALITQTDYIFDIEFYKGPIIALDVQLDTMQAPETAIVSNSSADSLAYIMYTSGSTGQPKGVLVPNRSVVRLVKSANFIQGSSEDTLLATGAVTFDATTFEYWSMLLNGGRLVLTNKEHLLDNEQLGTIIQQNKVNIMWFTAGWLNQLVDKSPHVFTGLKTIITGGDKLSPLHIGTLKSIYPSLTILNGYGPTENTTFSLTHNITEVGDNIPIGKPISNSKAYILGPELQLLPLGTKGEICVGGDGLALGYLNHPELTGEKFVENPFAPGERIYKTGDLGRWLPDGSIEFIGRKDDQVKVRGFRVELGEIETVLQQHPSIEMAVVMARPNGSGEKDIVAYLVSKEALNVTDLRAYLGVTLPAYMIPAYFVELDAMPLGPTGKVNKKALPDPLEALMDTGVEYVAPRNEKEKELVAVYEDVLKKQNIGVKDDFFALGGDSIKSIQVVSRLKQRGYSLTIQDVLLCPVIENLADKVTLATRHADQETVEGIIPLSPIQHYFFETPHVDYHHFNQSILLNCAGTISENDLKASLDKIVLHHDALRMVFYPGPDGWVQESKGAEMGYGFEVLERGDDAQFVEHCERIQASIDLGNGPLLKVALFRRPTGDQLLMVAHHLVIDAVSWRILVEDLATLYQQSLAGQPLTLPPKTDSFKYWQHKQVAYAQSPTLQEEESYWQATEAMGFAPLPMDDSNGANTTEDVIMTSFVLDEPVTNILLTQCYKAYRTDVNDILLTGLGLAISECFGLNKVTIALEGHGRENIGGDEDITRTVGWFTAMYPVTLDMQFKQDAIRQLIEIKEALHRVPNKGIGYGVLRYMAKKPYQLQPQISFNYLGDFGTGATTEEGHQLFDFSGDYQGHANSPTRQRDAVLEITAIVAAGKMSLTISYSKKQYQPATIEKLVRSYLDKLVQLIEKLSAEESVTLTPVDFAYQGLSMDDLDKLNKMLGNQ